MRCEHCEKNFGMCEKCLYKTQQGFRNKRLKELANSAWRADCEYVTIKRDDLDFLLLQLIKEAHDKTNLE